MAAQDKRARFIILLDVISKNKGKWFRIADLGLPYPAAWTLLKLKHAPEIETRIVTRKDGGFAAEFRVSCSDFKIISDRFNSTGKIRPLLSFDDASEDKVRKQSITKYKRTKEDKLFNLAMGYTK